jgi:hypothetical protein
LKHRDLDVKVADRFVEREEPVRQAHANFARKATRGCDAEFASVRAGAGDNVQNRAGAGATQSNANELTVEIGKIGFGNPAQDNVLFNRRPQRVAAEAPSDIR